MNESEKIKDQDRLWKLMANKLAGEATEEELKELQALLAKYPDTGYGVQILEDLWKSVQPKETEKQDHDDAFTRHLFRMAEKNAEKTQEPALPLPQPTQQQTQPAQQQTQAPQQSTRPSTQKSGNQPVSHPRQRRWKDASKKQRLFQSLLNSGDQLWSYYRTVRRTLLRNKGFSMINILGLAMGMASAMLVLLWINNELSYDQFHEKKDRVYQVYNRGEYNRTIACWGKTPMVMAPELKMNYPQVEDAVRVNWVGAFTIGDQHLETQGYITDPAFFSLFSFPLVSGDAGTALNDPHSIVLTEKLAKKIFGDGDAIGRMIRVDSNARFRVTGVMKDLPDNTQFYFEYLIPWSYMKEVKWDNQSWDNYSVHTFVLLKPGVTEKNANALIRNIEKTHSDETKNEVFLHPMRKWWLYSKFENGVNTGGRIESVRIFGWIAGFILLIACINYMNLSTARSERSAREVGIRKVVGAWRSSLVLRFLGESLFISLLAGTVALLLIQPGLVWLNHLTGKELTVPYSNKYFWLSVFGGILFTGILAGIYPAFYLSAFQPMNVLKGRFKAAGALIRPRQILVVFQFAFAILFIICTLVIHGQIRYAKNRDTGYIKDNLAYVYIKGDIEKNYCQIRRELMNSGAITGITRTNSPITDIWARSERFTWAGKDPGTRPIFTQLTSDNDFAGTMGIKMVEGRDIDIVAWPADSSAILLNESAVKLMGFKHPVGQLVKSEERTWHVVGVIKDFLPGSPYDPVMPLVIQGPGNWFGTVTFKLNEKNAASDNINKIGYIFKKYNPEYPFDYHFVNESFGLIFEGERRTGMLATLFAGMTILISCLGLFALAAYMVESRVKEIGVRKVLGASITGITTLLSRDFVKLVLLSFAIASPVAWWAMQSWLRQFDYHIRISWWIFALTGLLSVTIGVVTVSFQALKAALANPIKSLRAE